MWSSSIVIAVEGGDLATLLQLVDLERGLDHEVAVSPASHHGDEPGLAVAVEIALGRQLEAVRPGIGAASLGPLVTGPERVDVLVARLALEDDAVAGPVAVDRVAAPVLVAHHHQSARHLGGHSDAPA